MTMTLFLCTAAGVAQDSGMPKTPPPATVADTLPTAVYAHPGGVDLIADMYLPKGSGPFPGVVFIHGGGWSSGDRKQLRRQAAAMAEQGMVGMAIEYRLAPVNPYPAAFDDATAAVRWLREHAAAYHVDPVRIGVVGSSAGGHLAAMLGVASRAGDTSGASVQAVVVLNGIFDLSSLPDGPMVPTFLGKPCTEATAACSAASPILHIHHGMPPFLVMHGNADQTVPYKQATDFAAKLRADHDPVEFYTAEGGPHTFWSKPTWRELAQKMVADFLVKTLTPGRAK